MAGKQLTGLRKRQQISQANKTMFIWVASAAVIVSFCLVLAQFLYKQAAFNLKIIDAKTEANSTLVQNVDNAKKLQEEMNGLLVNADLNSIKAKDTDSNFKVILDALPSINDPTTFATSLQRAILPRSGVLLEELEPPSSEGTADGFTDETADSSAPTDVQEQLFVFTVNGNFDQIQNMLKDLERVIRPFSVKRMSFQGGDNALRVEIDGVTYYSPTKTINIGKKTINP